MVRRVVGLLFLSAAGFACASDTVPAPEPTLEQPGAFVAVDSDDTGEMTLFRTLSRLAVQSGETILFVTVYDVTPSDWDDAREIAKGHEIPIRQELTSVSRSLLLQESYRVVWFRTLTEAEEARIP
jgi:hypothetical protein